MKVLVTGGAGYIGSHTVLALREAGAEVTVFDRLSTGHREAAGDARLVVGDLLDPRSLEAAFSGAPFEACVHFAGSIVTSESMQNPAGYFRNNVGGSVNLFEALVRHRVPAVVFSSSCAVYGNAASLPLTEDLPENPESPYAETKAMTERLLRWFHRVHGLSSISLRYFNAAGADPLGRRGQDFSPPSHLIPLAISAALGQRPSLTVYGSDFPTRDGTCIRDYIHVTDLARAHLRALEVLRAGPARCSHYNCGTGRGHTVSEVIGRVRAVSGRDFPVQQGPRRPGDPAALYADNTRIVRDLGWKPELDLDAIIETAWRWHAAHLRGYAG